MYLICRFLTKSNFYIVKVYFTYSPVDICTVTINICISLVQGEHCVCAIATNRKTGTTCLFLFLYFIFFFIIHFFLFLYFILRNQRQHLAMRRKSSNVEEKLGFPGGLATGSCALSVVT